MVASSSPKADVEIPDRRMRVRFSLLRNDDEHLRPAIRLRSYFTLPPDFPHGGIANIPGILMKQGETTRGVPFNGVAVKVTASFFLIGLSAVHVNRQRNVQVMKERRWLDARFADSAMRCRGLREDEAKWRTGLPGSRGRGRDSAHPANMKERSRPPCLILTRIWAKIELHRYPPWSISTRGPDHEHVSPKLTDVSQKPDKCYR